jgi:hypothetical protein
MKLVVVPSKELVALIQPFAHTTDNKGGYNLRWLMRAWRKSSFLCLLFVSCLSSSMFRLAPSQHVANIRNQTELTWLFAGSRNAQNEFGMADLFALVFNN